MSDDPPRVSHPPPHRTATAVNPRVAAGRPIYREVQSPAPSTQPAPAKPREAVCYASREPLDDVELNVEIELGRLRMRLADVLKLGPGAVLETDKRVTDAVDVWVNQTLVARGEVVVMDGRFAVRVTEVISNLRDERVR